MSMHEESMQLDIHRAHEDNNEDDVNEVENHHATDHQHHYYRGRRPPSFHSTNERGTESSSKPNMYSRDSIASRSSRQMRLAMEALAGEVNDESDSQQQGGGRSSFLSSSERGPSRMKMYQRDSISSRSLRNMKIAIDALAGEVDETATIRATRIEEDNVGNNDDDDDDDDDNDDEPRRPKPLPANARTVWMETATSSASTPPATKQVTTESNSPFATMLSWSSQHIPSISTAIEGDSKADDDAGIGKLQDVDLHEGSVEKKTPEKSNNSSNHSIRDSLRRVSHRFAQEMESLTMDLESEVSGHSRQSQTLDDISSSKQMLKNSAVHGQLHNSCAIHFEPLVEEDDWVFKEASDIALRRRQNNSNNNHNNYPIT